jgi:hypothetical protein
MIEAHTGGCLTHMFHGSTAIAVDETRVGQFVYPILRHNASKSVTIVLLGGDIHLEASVGLHIHQHKRNELAVLILLVVHKHHFKRAKFVKIKARHMARAKGTTRHRSNILQLFIQVGVGAVVAVTVILLTCTPGWIARMRNTHGEAVATVELYAFRRVDGHVGEERI